MTRNIHTLKIDDAPFEDMWDGAKTAELRHNDRDYQVGDELHFVKDVRVIEFRVTHVQRGYGLQDDYVMLSGYPAKMVIRNIRTESKSVDEIRTLLRIDRP